MGGGRSQGKDINLYGLGQYKNYSPLKKHVQRSRLEGTAWWISWSLLEVSEESYVRAAVPLRVLSTR